MHDFACTKPDGRLPTGRAGICRPPCPRDASSQCVPNAIATTAAQPPHTPVIQGSPVWPGVLLIAYIDHASRRGRIVLLN
jgi:hypothetical protein